MKLTSRLTSAKAAAARGARSAPVAEAPPAPLTVSAPAAEAPVILERTRESSYELYLRSIRDEPLLTPTEESALARRVRRGDPAARERMIKANLRLVVTIAHDYRDYGLPILDLINEGNIGLMKAVDRYDPDRGAKLSTYAAFWIRQSIQRALVTQAKTIRLPRGLLQQKNQLRVIEEKLTEDYGRQPSEEELAEALGVRLNKLRKLRLASQLRTSSLETPLGEEGDQRLGDIIPDERAEQPHALLEGKARNELLHELIDGLDQREQRILRERFGLDGGNERTLEEIGVRFGLTRERIRQLEALALKKLRRRLDERENGTSFASMFAPVAPATLSLGRGAPRSARLSAEALS